MIYTDLTKKAVRLAYEAHEGQTDRSGLPYILHPLHVAEYMTTEDSCVAALLHDVLEDTSLNAEDLIQAGFTKEQVDAVLVLTHEPEDGYMDYVRKIRENPISREVKKADLRHNMDITRLDTVTESDIKRCEKYREALKILDE